ncbi:antibiotic biosynthesis monooxygenase [uncultured Spongiibacter sp.]|uniref:antibiotic biosynthesis monooxygenase n=1 Tax=uncultured Spongiibacter sp. TaxID=870896 RepID=UPI002585DB01|nr:antibiotic biosynthesis monooxygenase [uncultured Spongiibacter sp.]
MLSLLGAALRSPLFIDNNEAVRMPQETTTDQSQALTVVISRRVKHGKEQEFEALSNEMTSRASHFPGYLGATMFRPASADDPEYRIVFKFSDPATLSHWEQSPRRLDLLQEIEQLLVTPSEREITEGIVTWFTLPGHNPVLPPPRYKMTLVSWLTLYPAVTAIFFLLGDWLATLPLPLRTLIVTATVMLLMSYVLMPRMTRWFSRWLYPKSNTNTR